MKGRLIYQAQYMMLDNWSIFFENTINSECYCELVLYPLHCHLNDYDIMCGYFQQNDATL
jgi:hypothetical protein